MSQSRVLRAAQTCEPRTGLPAADFLPHRGRSHTAGGGGQFVGQGRFFCAQTASSRACTRLTAIASPDWAACAIWK